MLLTERERAFLTVFIDEATTVPFQGPATTELHRRAISYKDLSHLLSAFIWEGSRSQEMPGSNFSQTPSCPWSDRETAVRRDQEVAADLETISGFKTAGIQRILNAGEKAAQ